MPLTEKGRKKKGAQVFYAMENAGKLSGVTKKKK